MDVQPRFSAEDTLLVEGFLAGRPEVVQKVDRWVRAVVDNRNWGLSYQREDILQEVRKRLFENLVNRRFQGDSSLKTYAVQVARYTCIEFLRGKIRAAALDVEGFEFQDSRPNPEQDLAATENEERAARALAALPDGCRELFEMIFNQKLPYPEIARRLGVAPGTVKSRAWRCRDLLMKLVKEPSGGK
jgi:RNA polymerase sigma-70 factor (ECF subfamily)